MVLTNQFLCYILIYSTVFCGRSAAFSPTYLFEAKTSTTKNICNQLLFITRKKQRREHLKKFEITSAINHFFFTIMTQWEVINTHKRKLFFKSMINWCVIAWLYLGCQITLILSLTWIGLRFRRFAKWSRLFNNLLIVSSLVSQ